MFGSGRGTTKLSQMLAGDTNQWTQKMSTGILAQRGGGGHNSQTAADDFGCNSVLSPDSFFWGSLGTKKGRKILKSAWGTSEVGFTVRTRY